MLKMKPEEEKVEDVDSNENILKDRGSVSSVNSVIKNQELAKNNEFGENKGSTAKINGEQYQYFLPKVRIACLVFRVKYLSCY